MKFWLKVFDRIFLKNIKDTNERVLKRIKFLYWPFINRKKQSLVFYDLDSRIYSCGFTDKLVGMVSSFAFAKANNLPFFIRHKEPFDLSDWLKPNQIPWDSYEGKITYSDKCRCLVVSINDTDRIKLIPPPHAGLQYHIYTNMLFVNEINMKYETDFSFHLLFAELFRISDDLSDAIDYHLSRMPKGFISVSFRFLNLLGDFPDSGSKELSEDKQKELINKSIDVIKQMRNQLSDSVGSILVTADSVKMLKAIDGLDCVYVIPGVTGHSGVRQNIDVVRKTMLDFFCISKASHVYLAKSEGMYNSKFARCAAMTTNKPFDVILY